MSTPQIKILLLLVLVLFIYSPSCRVEGFKHGMRVTHPLNEMAITKMMNTRKLMAVDIGLDYDYGGPNSKHDPRKGKPGTGAAKNSP